MQQEMKISRLARILVVDDTAASLQLMTNLLTEHGYMVHPASDGELALEFVRTILPDLILLDIRMPGMDGYEVCRRLKADERTRSIPIIFISILEDERDKVKGFQEGAVDYITKPFQPEEVLARVRTQLRIRELTEYLEHKVAERTKELMIAKERLQQELAERVRVETALRSERTLIANVMETSPIGIMTVDANGQITFANTQAIDILGLTRDEIALRVYNSPDWHLTDFAGDPFSDDKLPFRQVMNTRQSVYDVQYAIAWPDGRRVLLSINGAPMLNESGDVESVVLTVQDITEKLTLESQLRQAQKLESIGRLAGGLAHDFNNMLGVIIGHTELALCKKDITQPLISSMQEIQKAALRSSDLTRQLLAFARKQTIAPMVLDLNETVEAMLKMLRRLIGEDIELVWLPDSDLWPAKVDPSQIDQILANLCVNARDTIAGVGKITIETHAVTFDEAYCVHHSEFIPGDFVMLAVSDNGKGMDRETLEKAFEPFFTTKKMGDGTGLGLATVYGVVKQNNGFINVYSEPGKGSTFRIYLPRHRSKSDHVQKEQPAATVLQGHETILVVEDEDAIMEITKLTLESLGYRVLTAATPDEAFAMAREHGGEIKLLITDVVMPNMSGRDLAKELIAIYPELMILFMSGYTSNVIAHHGVLDDGIHFIQKPFSIQALAAKVREVLEANPASR